MNLFSKSWGLLIVTAFLLVSAIQGNDKKCERVKYVQGGSCGPSLGTKKHPFTSLTDAQNDGPNWDVLIVLSSAIPLDNGITLLDGQKLIGEENPTEIALSPTQPTITNTDLGSNGGNGVVADIGASITVENIYFKDTQTSAINYDNGKDLNVRNVLITGHNQSQSSDLFFPAAGINGECSQPGTTHIENVIIRNNITGAGILELLNVPNINRELFVCNCVFAELTSSTNKNDGNSGIYVEADASTSHVSVKNSYFHDFQTPTSPLIINNGVNCWAFDGAQMTVCVQDSSFFNLGPDFISTFYIQGISENEVNAGPANITLNVSHCSFAEPTNTNSVLTGIQMTNYNANGDMCVKESTFTNVFDTIVTVLGSDGTQKVRINGNTATGGFPTGNFYQAYTNDAPISTLIPNPQRITDVVIKDNTAIGGSAFGIQPNTDPITNISTLTDPWTQLTIRAEHNCFQASEAGHEGIFGFSTNPNVSAGNATVIAHKNSFYGFDPDISDDGVALVTYDVTKNFWGHTPPVPCIPGPCGAAQTCIGGICQGPTISISTPISLVNGAEPLTTSITCPHSCCQTVPLPVPQP